QGLGLRGRAAGPRLPPAGVESTCGVVTAGAAEVIVQGVRPSSGEGEKPCADHRKLESVPKEGKSTAETAVAHEQRREKPEVPRLSQPCLPLLEQTVIGEQGRPPFNTRETPPKIEV